MTHVASLNRPRPVEKKAQVLDLSTDFTLVLEGWVQKGAFGPVGPFHSIDRR